MMHSIYDLLGIIADFDEALQSISDKKNAIVKHLQQMDKINFVVPEFSEGLDWLNVREAPAFGGHLKGKIVVLDFFTYCCINCMHILPDLEAVERQFPASSGVAVVGVHSAKFLNEKVTANILSAVLRYNIHHPVVNDSDAFLWQALAVSCWPTLLFIGPKGQLLYSIAGEGHRKKIIEFLTVATEHYSEQLNVNDLPMSLEKDKAPTFNLSFPGKLCVWPQKSFLVISDTGNHRIIVTDFNGVVQHVIGSGTAGFKDGVENVAQFNSPQGLACSDDCIYVADTNNHSIRKVDFTSDTIAVSTLTGTGHQGTDKVGGKTFTSQEIASPWDVVLTKTPDEQTEVLLIAMAGTHQIWVFFLSDGVWLANKPYPKGTCVRVAGSGMEENRNNSYPEKASFAQPSGLAISSTESQHTVYIADSESSSIRSLSLTNGKVANVAGGARDPTDLFAYGDVDGKGCDAKLQHPLDMAVLDDSLFVADSYNHKIKCVDIKTKMCASLAGTGKPGSTFHVSDLNSCELNEPGGLDVDVSRRLLYIADTNNHSIKVLDCDSRFLSKLPIIFSQEKDHHKEEEENIDSSLQGPLEILPLVTSKVLDQKLQLVVSFNLPKGEHLNTQAPNSWTLSDNDNSGKKFVNSLAISARKGKLLILSRESASSTTQVSLNLVWPHDVSPGELTLSLTLKVFSCLDEGDVCLPPKLLHFAQPIRLEL